MYKNLSPKLYIANLSFFFEGLDCRYHNPQFSGLDYQPCVPWLFRIWIQTLPNLFFSADYHFPWLNLQLCCPLKWIGTLGFHPAVTLPQSLEHFSTHFLECTGRAPRSFWEATAKRGKRAQDAREGEGECTARSVSFPGFTKPVGTGPVTAVTGLTGPDRFRFRPVRNRLKFKF